MTQTERDLARSAELVRQFRAEHPDASDEELHAFLYCAGRSFGYWLGNFGQESIPPGIIATVGFY